MQVVYLTGDSRRQKRGKRDSETGREESQKRCLDGQVITVGVKGHLGASTEPTSELSCCTGEAGGLRCRSLAPTA